MTAIELCKAGFYYKNGKNVLEDINVVFKQNEVTAITGSNGAGKTTLGKLMSGILKPTTGNVIIYGRDSRIMKLGEIGKLVGYCFQNPDKQLFAATLEEDIGFALHYKGLRQMDIKAKVGEMLDLFQLENLRDSFPLNLSQGEKQRAVLAAILALEPKYLILDEPTSGLDVKRIGILTEILKKLHANGTGMTLISHDKDFIKNNAQRRLVISGKVISDA